MKLYILAYYSMGRVHIEAYEKAKDRDAAKKQVKGVVAQPRNVNVADFDTDEAVE